MAQDDICSLIETRGGCDFDAKPYRVSDYLSPEERVNLLTRIARSAAGHAVVCQAAQQAVRKYADVSGSRLGESLSKRKMAQALLSFVQRDVGYVPDPEGEWYQGVRYTLEHGGDCEDMAVLLVAMAACLGIRGKLIWLEQPRAKLNHVTAKLYVEDGGSLFRRPSGQMLWEWAEPTIAKARIGQHPYDAARWHGSANRLGF
jgi:hypothetical protein